MNLKFTQKERQMTSIRGVTSEKEKLSLNLAKIARSCRSLDELAGKLRNDGFEPYYRNRKLTGLWLGNRKYRLTTLGVGEEHLKALTREQKRLQDLKKKPFNYRYEREKER